MERKLAQPIKIGTMTLKNRIIMPPMVVRYASDDGFVTPRTRDYYEARAAGGAALVIVEATYVHPWGQIILSEPGISDDKFIPGIRELAQAIKRHGAKAGIQLNHGGRLATTPDASMPLVAPSAIAAPGRAVPQALTGDGIADIVGDFVRAALRAKLAGFDGVEIHGAHGYLLDQFISRASNQRHDEYGGSLPNRARMLVQVIRAVREACGPDFPVWCRINGQEYSPEAGLTLNEAKEVASLAEAAGAVMVSVTAIGPDSPVNANQSVFQPGIIAHLAAGIKEAVKIPVVAVGKMTAEFGEELVSEGKADLIAFGRALFADPEIGNKVMADKFEEIRPCILCLRCRDDLRSNQSVGVGCSVNAAIGRESAAQLTPAKQPKRVLVVGSGPGGMEAARVAALRGHQVNLWEKGSQIGGQLIPAGLAPYKDRIKPLVPYYETQLKKLGVKVTLNREATPAAIKEFAPDAVVLATGSVPLVPHIPGLDKARAVQAIDVLEGKAATGEHVAVIGAELVACEVAESLALQGKKVTIMRRSPEVAVKVGPNIRGPLLARLKEEGVNIFTGITYNRVDNSGITITTRDGEKKTIPADTIVLAAGATADQSLYQQIQGKYKVVQLVGDCVSPRTIRDAVTEGYQVGSVI